MDNGPGIYCGRRVNRIGRERRHCLDRLYEQTSRQGTDLLTSVVTAGHLRMRPIIMTTLTTLAGLLPMALGYPDFNIAWTPFATAFISGLIISTLMTLMILPLLYYLLARIRLRITQRGKTPNLSTPGHNDSSSDLIEAIKELP